MLLKNLKARKSDANIYQLYNANQPFGKEMCLLNLTWRCSGQIWRGKNRHQSPTLFCRDKRRIGGCYKDSVRLQQKLELTYILPTPRHNKREPPLLITRSKKKRAGRGGGEGWGVRSGGESTKKEVTRRHPISTPSSSPSSPPLTLNLPPKFGIPSVGPMAPGQLVVWRVGGLSIVLNLYAAQCYFDPIEREREREREKENAWS